MIAYERLAINEKPNTWNTPRLACLKPTWDARLPYGLKTKPNKSFEMTPEVPAGTVAGAPKEGGGRAGVDGAAQLYR